MSSRALTQEEVTLARSIFGEAIAYDRVRIHNRKWWPFQPRRVTMAPDGDLWFHPQGGLYCDDFCASPLNIQGLFIHEMTHAWQAQRGGKWYLPLMRHPFCRYDYTMQPSKPFARYGLEQQAEIVRHAFLMRQGLVLSNLPPLSAYEAILPFRTR
ncbi:vgr related protein [Sphingobium aromaticiconvertens]|uniref:vgr related protein n=1 Tax=Sphingobium aromaticiconvertens TaxID=365341 RepID=UPI003018151C